MAKRKTKRWGKIGAPRSAKRRRWLKQLRAALRRAPKRKRRRRKRKGNPGPGCGGPTGE
ncbi:MAG: hypothetical protein MUP30_08260 [Deltaproteobacteria bacterium]|nr:hypothetical protein [Deltaproteobacteria bacterium]